MKRTKSNRRIRPDQLFVGQPALDETARRTDGYPAPFLLPGLVGGGVPVPSSTPKVPAPTGPPKKPRPAATFANTKLEDPSADVLEKKNK